MMMFYSETVASLPLAVSLRYDMGVRAGDLPPSRSHRDHDRQRRPGGDSGSPTVKFASIRQDSLRIDDWYDL